MGYDPTVFTKDDARRERLQVEADDMVFSGLHIFESLSSDEYAALDSLIEQCQDGSYPDAALGEMLRKVVLGRVEAMRDAFVRGAQ
jgi:hypothetical protein